MSKRLLLVKRSPAVALDAFRAELPQTVAAADVLHLTDMSGYRAHEPIYDAVIETWGGGAPRSDLVDGARSWSLDVEEVAMVDGAAPSDGVSAFYFLNRLPGTERSEFQRYWREHHGPIASRVPGVRRYIQNHVVGNEGPYDGVAQTSFDDLDSMRTSVGSAELALTRADEANFMVSGRLPFVICTSVQ